MNDNGETAYSIAFRRGAYDIAKYIESFEFVLTKGVHCEETRDKLIKIE